MQLQLYRHTYFFYFSSISIPWILWLYVGYISHAYPGDYNTLVSIGSLLGLVTPLLVALVLILPEKQLRKDLIGRFDLSSVSPKYLTITFLLMPFSILTAQLISLLFGYDSDQFQYRDGYTFSSGIFPVWFILLVAPLVEELAWHSYGTDCLRSKFNLLKTSLLFGLIWGVWHLPLTFIKDYYHSNLVETGLLYTANFFLSLFPFVLIMNWLYYKTNRNITITIILHISAGYFNELFATAPMSKVIQTGLLTLLAAHLFTHDKNFFLKTKTIIK